MSLDTGSGTALLFEVLHFGSLHPYERWLAIVLAFGPFVVLGVVIAVRRRQDANDPDPAGRAPDQRPPDESGPR